jgi:hypothetical protein
MPETPSFYLVFRSLKGAPLSCLFALIINHSPANLKWLMYATGYERQEVLDALDYLVQIHFIYQLPDKRWDLSITLDMLDKMSFQTGYNPN